MIDTKAIRSKILDLAMRGLLTEQLSEDGTAEELYQQIQTEKRELIKAGKIKKEKPLPPISEDEIPFEIPKNWKWVRLRDICKKIVDGDHNPPSGVKEKTEYLMLSAQNIINDRIENIETARYLSKEVFIEENKRTNLEKGDVLLTIVATLGRSCVYRENYNVCFQRSVCVISTSIMPEFLKRFFDSGYIQKLMVDGATGAAQPGFYLNKVEKMCVPLPPLEEQKRIVDRIESAIIEIRHIDDLQAKYSNDLAVLKSKIIDAAIQGKLTKQLPEDGTAEELYQQIQTEKAKLIKEGKIKKEKPFSTNIQFQDFPFDIPDTWVFVRFGELMISRDSERVPVSTDERAHRAKVYDYYGASGVIDQIDDYLFDKELLLIGEDGANLLARSAPIAFLAHGKYWVNNHAHVLDACTGLDLKYVCYYINAISLAPYVTGTAQPKMNQENMNAIWVPLPPLAEQKRIVKKLEEVLAVCDSWLPKMGKGNIATR